MAKNIQTGIEIKAGVTGTEAIKQLAATIGEAGVDTAKLGEESQALSQAWADIENRHSLINQYKALKVGLKEVNTEMTHTRQQMTQLQAQMADGATKEQTDQYKKLEKQLNELTDKKRLLGRELRNHSGLMQQAGLAVRNLAAHEKQLAAEADAAKAKLDALGKEAAELKAIADAKITLGIDTDERARTEIAKTVQAYELLKNSGQLSSSELARANELHLQKVRQLEAGLQSARVPLADLVRDIGNMAGTAGGLAYIGREAMQFEQAMVGVKKVVDGTPEQIAALGAQIKDLSVALGISAEEVAAIAAQGGQLGIPIQKLGEFTELAGKMAVAFGISAEEAADATAKLANVFQLPIEQVGLLGDAINNLGNNTAAKERDIIAAMARIGGNAKQFGLAAEEAAALADAFIALGRPPEVAATAINALLSKLQTAGSQSAEFRAGLHSMGISAEELARNIAANPQQALSAFLRQLEQLDAQSRSIVLTKMFGTEYSDDIALLIGSLGEYDKALGLVADKTKYAGALQKEFDAAMDTATQKLNQAKQLWNNVARDIGTHLLPVLSAAAGGVTGIGEAVSWAVNTFPGLTQLAVIMVSARLALSAFGRVMQLTGATAKDSMFQAELGIRQVDAALNRATASASRFRTELAAADTARGKLGVIGGEARNLAGNLGKAANATASLFGAFGTGYGVGTALRESFDWVRDLGDEMARVAAYVDAVFTDRTFDDVRQNFRTVREELAETERQKRLQAQEDARRAEENQRQFAERRAGLDAMRTEYARLQAALDNNQRSLQVLNEAGRASGPIFDELARSTEAIREEMAKLKAEMDGAGEQLAAVADTQALAALETLGLTMKQVQTGISEENEKILSAFEAAAAGAGHSADSMGRLFKAALDKLSGSPEAVEALKSRLRQIGEEAGLTAKEIEAIADKAPETADKVAAAFAKIGVHIRETTEGVSQAAEQSFKDFEAASEAMREAGIRDSRLIRSGFEQVFAKLKSRQEFEAFRTQLQHSGDVAKLTQEQIKRLNEAAEKGASAAATAYDKLAQSVKDAADKSSLDRLAATAEAAMQNGEISAAQYEQALLQIQERTRQLSADTAKLGQTAEQSHRQAADAAQKNADASGKAAAATQKQAAAMQGAGQAAGQAAAGGMRAYRQITFDILSANLHTAESAEALREALKGVRNASIQPLGANLAWRQSIRIIARYEQGLRDARAATEALNRKTEEGTVTLDDISQAAGKANIEFGRLDKTTLSALHGAIDKARAKIQALQDEAAATRAALEADLAELQGDDGKRAALEQEAKLRELNLKLSEAERANNRQAADDYRQAIELQGRLYQARREKAAADKLQQQREAEARETAKQPPVQQVLQIGETAVPLADTEAAARQLGEALNVRDGALVQKVVQTLMQQIHDEIKRSGR